MLQVSPMQLLSARAPVDDPAWLVELKYDGFRALAYLRDGTCQLVSRTGRTYKQFGALCQAIAAALPGVEAVLDGEVVCLDEVGRPQFYSLMYKRGQPVYAAFDLVMSENSACATTRRLGSNN